MKGSWLPIVRGDEFIDGATGQEMPYAEALRRLTVAMGGKQEEMEREVVLGQVGPVVDGALPTLTVETLDELIAPFEERRRRWESEFGGLYARLRLGGHTHGAIVQVVRSSGADGATMELVSSFGERWSLLAGGSDSTTPNEDAAH